LRIRYVATMIDTLPMPGQEASITGDFKRGRAKSLIISFIR